MSDKNMKPGDIMVALLEARSKKARKPVSLTTEVLAEAAGVPIKQAYDRLWWMEKRMGLLQSTGVGKDRLWRIKPSARPRVAEGNVSATHSRQATAKKPPRSKKA